MADVLRLTSPYMRGDEVVKLQTLLDFYGYPLEIDGIYGSKTEEAVKRYQTDHDLEADGIVGSKTWARLKARPTAEGLVAYCYDHIGDIYVWGGNGQTEISEAWIKQMESSSANATRSIKAWQAKLNASMTDIAAYDCSGLISRYLQGYDAVRRKQNCNNLRAMCNKIGKGELQPGDLVFRHKLLDSGVHDYYHIGVYVGKGRVIEAKGRDDGVVLRGIDAQEGYWTDYARISIWK